MRCPDCNKFVSQEMAEPELTGEELNDDGALSAEVRIVATCGECSTELKEATLTVEGDVLGVDNHKGEGHELSADGWEVSGTERSEGRGRGCRTYYGAEVTVTVTCSCGGIEEKVTMKDEVQASEMDELV